jgi:RNA polymerase sigma-70 factor (ECF subfamily)
MCCHPALATEAQVALTLRALGGLTTEEIAAAFLVSPETMKRRLSRAKARIKTTGIPFRVPPEHLLAGRLAGEPEIHGLLALMLCHDARRRARFSNGELVLLEDQDRSLWNANQIAEGRAVLERALALHGRGSYVFQAAIASLQVEERIDWPQVAALYGELVRLTQSPVVELNRAVAVAQAGSPQAALGIVEGLELDDYPYLHSTRAELLRRLGRAREARAAYRRALELTRNEPERRFLQRRLNEP